MGRFVEGFLQFKIKFLFVLIILYFIYIYLSANARIELLNFLTLFFDETFASNNLFFAVCPFNELHPRIVKAIQFIIKIR